MARKSRSSHPVQALPLPAHSSLLSTPCEHETEPSPGRCLVGGTPTRTGRIAHARRGGTRRSRPAKPFRWERKPELQPVVQFLDGRTRCCRSSTYNDAASFDCAKTRGQGPFAGQEQFTEPERKFVLSTGTHSADFKTFFLEALLVEAGLTSIIVCGCTGILGSESRESSCSQAESETGVEIGLEACLQTCGKAESVRRLAGIIGAGPGFEIWCQGSSQFCAQARPKAFGQPGAQACGWRFRRKSQRFGEPE